MPTLTAATEYVQKNKKIMEKERKITAPEGYEIEKVELVYGVAVITFKEKERKIPKSWEEFCEMTGVKIPCNLEQRILDVVRDRPTAEAVLALCKLIQLRNAFNGEWMPDYSKEYTGEISVYTIHFEANEIIVGGWRSYATTPLYFKSRELRDEFLRYFRPLIEKLKPLYGIKEGGAE